MKFVLFTATIAAATLASAASAAVLTVGGPLADLCFKSAKGADGRTSALEACTRALDEDSLPAPDKAATYVNRGIVLMNGGRFSDADADFDSALKIVPMLPDSWLNKGLLRIREGNGNAALPMIQRAIASGAGNQALAIFARGVAHEQSGDYADAFADFQRARALAPGWTLPREYLVGYRVTNP